jgi:type III secretory pathway lipoprotein EscJ
MRALLTIAIIACAPMIDGPIERQRTIDRQDAERLALQLGQLPGALHAEVVLHRPVFDPLTRQQTPASAAVVLVIDDHADRAALTSSVRDIVQASAPEIAEPKIAIAFGWHRPELATVGPFTVEAGSAGRLRAVLAIAFGALALCASWIAWHERVRVVARR